MAVTTIAAFEAIPTAISAGAAAEGIGATVAGALGTAALGAEVGALGSALQGGNVGLGALTGGLTGGIGSVAGAELGGLGLGLSQGTTAVIGDVLGGLATSAITGQSLGKGALGGLEAGLVSQALAGAKGPAGATGGGAGSAAGTAASAAGVPAASIDPNAVTASAANAGGIASPDLGLSGGSGLPGSISSAAGSLGTGAAAGLPGTVGQGASSGALSDATGITPAATGAPQNILPASAGGTAGGPTNILPSSYDGISTTPAGGSALSSGVPTMTASQDASIYGTPSAGPLSTILGGAGGGTGAGGGLLGSPQSTLAMAGLAANVLRGNQMPQGYSNLNASASALNAQGQQLESYINSGQLPPGLQAGLNQATNSAVAAIQSRYAQRGMTGSTAEAQDIANARLMAQTQGAQMAIQLYQQGVSDTQLSDQLYAQIMQASVAMDQQTSNAIGGFAAALAGMGRAPATPGA